MTFDKISRYSILEEFSKQGYVNTYHAIDSRTGLDRLLTVYDFIDLNTSALFNQISVEAKKVAQLDHPGIPCITDIDINEQKLYVCTDYAEGERFDLSIEKHGDDKDNALIQVQIAQLSKVIDFAHRQGIVHHDLVPDNIIVGSNHVWLINFYSVNAMTSSVFIDVTKARYIPPEVWKGESVTSASNIYSFACIVYEAIAGRPLVDGESIGKIREKHLSSNVELIENLSNVNDEFRRNLIQCLNQDPGMRLSSTHHLVNEDIFTSLTVRFVKTGPKLDNAAMQELLYRLKTKHGMTYRELLSVYLTMDMAVEKGNLTNDIIDYLKRNPDMVSKF